MKSALQMKLNPSLSPDAVGFHHEVISSTAGGFIPSGRTDLVEKKQPLSGRQRLFLFWRRVRVIVQRGSLISSMSFGTVR